MQKQTITSNFHLPISNKTRLIEISAVILTATGKFIFMDRLDQKFSFVAIAIICWVSYIIYRIKTLPGINKYWGFRTDNFKIVLKKVLPFGIISFIVCICVGLFQNTLNISWHIIPILILYPIWGTIQQFLLIALIAGNMQDLQGQRLNKTIIIFISAVLFGAIHYPYLWLIFGTFVLALFYGWIYLSKRNIYVLGLFHGWLGGIFYYTVLDRDPFIEMFGRLLNKTT